MFLADLLVMPVQRVPRYKLLFEVIREERGRRGGREEERRTEEEVNPIRFSAFSVFPFSSN